MDDINMILWNELKKHRGHKVSIVSYGDWDNPKDVCLECEDCGEVVLDAEIYTLCARMEENNMMWTKLFNVVGIDDLEGEVFARCTTYEKSVKAKDCLENNGFENMIDIVQDEIPVDVIEIDSQLLEL